MAEQVSTETITDTNFKLLSVAALLKKVRDGITTEHLYLDAERKFDILIDILNDIYTDNSVLGKFGYSLDELKQLSYLIFNQLIINANSNPYITLCLLEGAPLEEVKRRRNKLLHIYHPDRNREEHASGAKTMRINEAYQKILNQCHKTDIQFNNIKTNVPYYYSNNKKNKLIIYLVVAISLLVFVGFMTSYYFF